QAAGDEIAQWLQRVRHAHAADRLPPRAYGLRIDFEVGREAVAVAAHLPAGAGAVCKAVHPFLDAQVVDVALGLAAAPMAVADLLPASAGKSLDAGPVHASKVRQRGHRRKLSGGRGPVQRRSGDEVEAVEIDAVRRDRGSDVQVLAPDVAGL